MKFFEIDWQSVFVPTESLLEIFVRGTIMYLVMFALLRVFRRQAGSVGIADLLVIVVIADAAQNGMAGDSKSVTEAVLLIGTIVGWDYFFDWLGYKSKLFERIFEPAKLKIIEDGRFLRANMRKEMITVGEVLSQMRQSEIEHVTDVRLGYLESDGHFSFIRKDRAQAESN
ncbi:MAG: DUF421 domain-containing protein [Acidobacteria bacterium]|nr:DUF421 domain-containing protein [Acidobacteriota bacterium]